MIGSPNIPQQLDCCRDVPRVQIRRVAGLAFNFSAAPASHKTPPPSASVRLELPLPLSRLAYPSFDPTFLNFLGYCEAR
ncbi:MAG: hypothetical protein ACYCSN_06835 [Acidobacteriaceae bacterium]